ncbi:hypothetical protein B0T09DRAFT_256050 [Sordaria sp. MPI-SDFR-AT-0083]|nr:hypothetical protein B0T09DRAFT_256050 [Sordaria sp. MPI-SDFR-AT-0083]
MVSSSSSSSSWSSTVSIASEFSVSSASSICSSEASSSTGSPTSSEVSSNGTVIYTPSPAGPENPPYTPSSAGVNRRIPQPTRQPLRPPTGSGGFLRPSPTRPENARITDNAVLEHIWGQPFDESLSWLGRTMWGQNTQYSGPASELFGTQNPLAIHSRPQQPVPTHNPLLDNPRPRQPAIVDGSAGWWERQYQRTRADMGPTQLQEEMTRIREEEQRVMNAHRRIVEARRRIAGLLRPPWTRVDNSAFISPNIPPRYMTVNMGFPFWTNGFPQHISQRSSAHVRQRSGQVQVWEDEPVRQQSNQIRQEESEAEPLSDVSPFQRGRNIPQWATYSNIFGG